MTAECSRNESARARYYLVKFQAQIPSRQRNPSALGQSHVLPLGKSQAFARAIKPRYLLGSASIRMGKARVHPQVPAPSDAPQSSFESQRCMASRSASSSARTLEQFTSPSCGAFEPPTVQAALIVSISQHAPANFANLKLVIRPSEESLGCAEPAASSNTAT